MTERKETDRITYGASRKISDGNWGSYDFHFSYSTSIDENEEAQDAAMRAVFFVEDFLITKVLQARDKQLKY